MQGNKEQIEAAMAEMAVAQLSSRIPALFDHYVGFEISEIEDDGARAFGLLGFAIRSTEIYVPAIFLSGRIKGTETMNLAAQGMFTSCTRSWIDYIAEKARTQDVGAPGNPPKGGVGPSAALEVYRSPEYAFSSKYASLHDMVSRTAASAPDLDVPRLLKIAGPDSWESFARLAVADEAIAEAMFRHYGPRAMEMPDFAPARRFSYKGAASMVGSGAPKEEVPDLPKVVSSEDSPEAASLSEEKKVDLATTGIAVVDPRSGDEKTRLVPTVSRTRTTNPNRPGVYTVLSASGLEPMEAVLVPSPFPIERPSRPMPGTLAMGAGDGADWFWSYRGNNGNQDRRRIVAMADSSDSAGDKLAEIVSSRGIPLSQASPGKTYVLARGDGGAVSMPFVVVNKAGGRILAASAGLSWDERLGDWSKLRRAPSHPSHLGEGSMEGHLSSATDGFEGGAWLEPVEADGHVIVETGRRTMVPSSWKLLPVPGRDGSENSPAAKGAKGRDPLLDRGIATLDEIEAATLPPSGRKSAGLPGHERLRVENDGSNRIRVSWRGGIRSWRRKSAAVEALVSVVGLGESDARSLVESAARGGTAYDDWAEPRGFHKTAAAIDIPWPDELVREGSTEYSGTREVYPSAAMVRGVFEGYHDRSRDYDPALSNYNMVAGRTVSGGGIDGIVSRAARSGIKQVFDMAVASFLMRGGRLAIQIDQDILPALEAGLDRACRLLLRFYWSNDEFASSYGTDGMAEFEDIMLSNIRETGKTVLFLKRRGGNASESYDELNSLSEE